MFNSKGLNKAKKTWIIKIPKLHAKCSKAIGNALNAELQSLKCLFNRMALSQSTAATATETKEATGQPEAHLANAKHTMAIGSALNAELKSLNWLSSQMAPSQSTAAIATEAKEADFNLNKFLFD